MKQSFIYLGEGLTDLFEFTTLIEYNYKRVDAVVFFHTPKSQKQLSSVGLVMATNFRKSLSSYLHYVKCSKVSIPRK
jgi:hypothetical protein